MGWPCGAMNKIAPPQHEVPLYVRYFRGLVVCETHQVAHSQLRAVDDGQQLVAWADEWASDDEWRRARDSIRAFRYKSRHHLTRTNIDQTTKEILEQRARTLGLPLWQYVQQLGLTAEVLEQLEQRRRISCTGNAASPER